ncbi:hypothetical protein [Gelidibacter maritimus]|uniref:Uncharacterized protein n=1 Tax=Gelidibacter maritimus TaxID=2761487 RepID=A0A7W2R4D3_9FLAO|nr:hypothetical protein [Gelidibacter maritimus]MBA6153704.1 hypothetical protein [Gelidibacter maritimus]
MKKTFLIALTLLILTASCSNRQNTLDNYANYSVKVTKQKIEYPNGDFSISIPINWEWTVEDYENKNILFGIDAVSNPDKDGFVDILSIQKIKSFGDRKDLESEFDYYLELLETNWDAKVIETGKTNLLNEEAYFLHTKSNTETYGEIETVSFVLESETKGVFFNLTASASQTDELKKNMAILIQCLRTFKMNNSG